MDMAVNEMFFEKYPDTVLSHQVQVRPFNADKTRNMRALNPEGKSVVCMCFFIFLPIKNNLNVQQKNISGVCR